MKNLIKLLELIPDLYHLRFSGDDKIIITNDNSAGDSWFNYAYNNGHEFLSFDTISIGVEPLTKSNVTFFSNFVGINVALQNICTIGKTDVNLDCSEDEYFQYILDEPKCQILKSIKTLRDYFGECSIVVDMDFSTEQLSTITEFINKQK